MKGLSFSTKLEILPPKIDMKNDSPKMKAAIRSAVTAGTIKAGAYVQRDLKIALNKAMDSGVWNWNGKSTIRSTGAVVGTPRDIVDTGALKKSLVLAEKNLQTKASITIKYRSPYAAITHYGGAVRPYGNKLAATVIIPGRPWISATLRGTHGIEKFNMKSPMQKGFQEVWTSRFG